VEGFYIEERRLGLEPVPHTESDHPWIKNFLNLIEWLIEVLEEGMERTSMSRKEAEEFLRF